MATWNFDSPIQDAGIQEVQNYLTENLQSTKAGVNGARMLDLYKFLQSNTFASPEQLRASVIQQGEPLFSPEEAAQVFNQLKMRGGGESVEFFDSMARKLAGFTGDFIPTSAKGYLYFLKGLEQNPDQGPLVSTALDVVGQGLPTLAATIQTVAPQLIGALPIPSAAIAGVIIGWIMSAFLLFLAIVTNLSRKKFGSAFVTSMGLVPVVGSSIMNAAKSVERVTGKVSDRRQKLVKSVNSVFGPAVGQSVSEYIPNLDEPEETAPTTPGKLPSLASLKGRLPTSLTDATASLTKSAKELASKAPSSLSGIKSSMQGLASKAPSLADAKAAVSSRLPTSLTDATASLTKSAKELASKAPSLADAKAAVSSRLPDSIHSKLASFKGKPGV